MWGGDNVCILKNVLFPEEVHIDLEAKMVQIIYLTLNQFGRKYFVYLNFSCLSIAHVSPIYSMAIPTAISRIFYNK